MENADNPRFTQDNTGQWWYRFGSKNTRLRVQPRECRNCHEPYLPSGSHVRQDCCSRSCGNLLRNRLNPGKFAGPGGGRWRGGRRVGSDGYVWVWNPEAAERMRPGTKKPYVVEHRLVMEQKLGRYLWSFENVHHKNGRREDNRPENLEVWITNQPYGQRMDDLLAFVVEHYRDELTARLG